MSSTPPDSEEIFAAGPTLLPPIAAISWTSLSWVSATGPEKVLKIQRIGSPRKFRHRRGEVRGFVIVRKTGF